MLHIIATTLGVIGGIVVISALGIVALAALLMSGDRNPFM